MVLSDYSLLCVQGLLLIMLGGPYVTCKLTVRLQKLKKKRNWELKRSVVCMDRCELYFILRLFCAKKKNKLKELYDQKAINR